MSEIKQLNALSKKLDNLSQENAVNDAKIQKDIEYLTREVAKLTKQVETNFVSKAEFEPIKKLVYGVVGLILTAVVVAVLTVIIPR